MTTFRNPKKYGWIPDLPDRRDYKFVPKFKKKYRLPSTIDLRSKFTAPYDQGELGSCTAQAIAGAIEYVHTVSEKGSFMPSRLFVYFNEREIEGTVNEDAGAMIRDGIKSVVSQGVCAEELWPYTISKFRDKPNSSCYEQALDNQVLLYRRVTEDLYDMKACLASGFPFVFGMAVYTSFESSKTAKTGVVSMPASKEKMLGGHAMLAVGYSNSDKAFIVRNSWGAWGDKGYCYIPYEYIADDNLADDRWMITSVE